MVDLAIETTGLTKQFGDIRAVDQLDMSVPIGAVYGFLGPNGAGKSTTIKMLLDVLRPTAGTAKVLGLDTRRDAVNVQHRVGYLPGDFVVDGRQTSAELLTYLGRLRGGIEPKRIAELTDRLDLDTSRAIRTLSKGNLQKVGLVQAFMHDPELLILDEPTSGLDPFLQHEFASMVHEASDRGHTVFLSSHVMSEVQQIADQVGIIRHGQLVAVEQVEDLLERSTRKVSVHFGESVQAADFEHLIGVSNIQVDGSYLTCLLAGRADALVKELALHTVITLAIEEPDLEDLFFKYYEHTNRGDHRDVDS